MKKLLSVLTIFVIAIVAQTVAFGQKQAVNKQELIIELLEVINAEEQTIAVMNSIMDAQDDMYASIIDDHFSDQDISEAKRAELRAIVNDVYKRIAQKMKVRVNELDLKTFYRDLLVQIYDKYFTKEDLTTMITFYRTPAGAKLIANMNNIAIDSMKAVQEKMMPQWMKISKEIIDEEMPVMIKAMEQALEN